MWGPKGSGLDQNCTCTTRPWRQQHETINRSLWYLVTGEIEGQGIVYGRTDERVSHKVDLSLTSRANKMKRRQVILQPIHKQNVDESASFDQTQSENTTSTYMKSFDETTGMHINCYDSSTYVLVKRGIRIANLNICHILNKMDELKILLSDKRSVDILGVCETFLNDDILDALITAGGFNFERKDRNVKS